MKYYTGRQIKTPAFPCAGDRHVYFRRQDIGELVERECGLVAENPDVPGPQPEGNEILVVSGGKMDHPVDSAPHPNDLPVSEVLGE